MRPGQMDAGAWSCGRVAGLIHAIAAVQALIDRSMRAADTTVNARLRSAMAG